MATDPARPVGDARAEHSRCLVRLGARPIAWIDPETGDVRFHTLAGGDDFREALVVALIRLRDAESPEATATIEDVVHDMRKVRGLRATKDGEFLEITPDEMRSVLRGRIGGLLRQPEEFRREGALESDPYARGGFSFADLVDYSRQEITYHDAATGIMRSVRDRVIDDVHAAHRMLDAAGVDGGPLTARIGLMMLPRVVGSSESAIEKELKRRMSAGDSLDITVPRRSHGSGEPLADFADVKVPKADDVLAVLDQLTGEEAFKVFDHVNVLPGRTAEARLWVLTDPDDVRRMVAECCAVALNVGKLAEVYKAAREALERKGTR